MYTRNMISADLASAVRLRTYAIFLLEYHDQWYQMLSLGLRMQQYLSALCPYRRELRLQETK